MTPGPNISHVSQESVSLQKITSNGGMRTAFWSCQAIGLVLIAFSSFFPRLFHIQEYVFFILLISALVVSWMDKYNPWVRTPMDLPLVCFSAWVLVTIPFAIDPTYSFGEWRKFIALTLVFYWSLFVLRGEFIEHLPRYVLSAVVLGSIVLSSYALIDFLIRGGTWWDRLIRAGAPHSDYNWLTTYMVLVIPMLVAVFFVSRGRWLRFSAGLALPLAILAQTASYTRAGWVAHVAQGMTFGLLTGRRRLVLWIAGGTGSIVLLLAALSQVGFQRETINPLTLDQRLGTWKLGMEHIAAHPLVGVGYGNDTFTKLHPEYSIQAQQGRRLEEQVLPAMHNTFLMVAMGSGLPAFVLFLWVLVRMFSFLVKLRNSTSHPESGGLLLGVAVVVVGFITRNTFDYMFTGSLASLFWILLAIGFSTQKRQPVG